MWVQITMAPKTFEKTTAVSLQNLKIAELAGVHPDRVVAYRTEQSVEQLAAAYKAKRARIKAWRVDHVKRWRAAGLCINCGRVRTSERACCDRCTDLFRESSARRRAGIYKRPKITSDEARAAAEIRELENLKNHDRSRVPGRTAAVYKRSVYRECLESFNSMQSPRFREWLDSQLDTQHAIIGGVATGSKNSAYVKRKAYAACSRAFERKASNHFRDWLGVRIRGQQKILNAKKKNVPIAAE